MPCQVLLKVWLKAGKGPGKREKSPGEAVDAGKADVVKSKMNIRETLGLGPQKKAPMVNLVDSDEEDSEGGEEEDGGGALNFGHFKFLNISHAKHWFWDIIRETL